MRTCICIKRVIPSSEFQELAKLFALLLRGFLVRWLQLVWTSFIWSQLAFNQNTLIETWTGPWPMQHAWIEANMQHFVSVTSDQFLLLPFKDPFPCISSRNSGTFLQHRCQVHYKCWTLQSSFTISSYHLWEPVWSLGHTWAVTRMVSFCCALIPLQASLICFRYYIAY